MADTSTLRFGDFSFAHNPAKLKVVHSQKIQRIPTPFHGVYQKALSETNRVVSGEGELFGSDASLQLQTLSSLFQTSPYLLVIPDYASFYAFFSDLTVLRQVGESIHYTFEFTEESCTVSESATLSTVHRAKKNENLFSIASQYGKTMEELFMKNPQLISPFAVMEGDWIEL